MVLRTSQPRKTPTNQNMTLHLSTNQKVIIFHPRGDGQELSGLLGWIVCGRTRTRTKNAMTELFILKLTLLFLLAHYSCSLAHSGLVARSPILAHSIILAHSLFLLARPFSLAHSFLLTLLFSLAHYSYLLVHSLIFLAHSLGLACSLTHFYCSLIHYS